LAGENNRYEHLSAPVKFWGQRLSLLALVIAAIALLILSRSDNTTLDKVEALAHDAASPVLVVLYRPVEWIGALVGSVRSYGALREENAALRQEMQRLKSWESVAVRLDYENGVLRRFLNAKMDGLGPVIAGRVIADSGGPYVRAVIVNAGAEQGASKGRAVTDGHNTVGQVLTVGTLSSRILLLTDLNSRVPVMIERTGDRAILSGDNSPLPELRFLPVGAEVLPGDQVLTSGDGGIFPARLPVGEAVMTDDGIRIRPYADFDHLEYVLILDYHFPELKDRVPATDETDQKGGTAP